MNVCVRSSPQFELAGALNEFTQQFPLSSRVSWGNVRPAMVPFGTSPALVRSTSITRRKTFQSLGPIPLGGDNLMAFSHIVPSPGTSGAFSVTHETKSFHSSWLNPGPGAIVAAFAINSLHDPSLWSGVEPTGVSAPISPVLAEAYPLLPEPSAVGAIYAPASVSPPANSFSALQSDSLSLQVKPTYVAASVSSSVF